MTVRGGMIKDEVPEELHQPCIFQVIAPGDESVEAKICGIDLPDPIKIKIIFNPITHECRKYIWRVQKQFFHSKAKFDFGGDKMEIKSLR